MAMEERCFLNCEISIASFVNSPGPSSQQVSVFPNLLLAQLGLSGFTAVIYLSLN